MDKTLIQHKLGHYQASELEVIRIYKLRLHRALVAIQEIVSVQDCRAAVAVEAVPEMFRMCHIRAMAHLVYQFLNHGQMMVVREALAVVMMWLLAMGVRHISSDRRSIDDRSDNHYSQFLSSFKSRTHFRSKMPNSDIGCPFWGEDLVSAKF